MRTLSGISGNKKGKTPNFSGLSFLTTCGTTHKITCSEYSYPPPELKKVPKVCHIHLWLSFDTHFQLKQRVMPHRHITKINYRFILPQYLDYCQRKLTKYRFFKYFQGNRTYAILIHQIAVSKRCRPRLNDLWQLNSIYPHEYRFPGQHSLCLWIKCTPYSLYAAGKGAGSGVGRYVCYLFIARR